LIRDEYETRKRRLEEELRAGMELLQASFQTQVRALEMVWIGGGGEPVSTLPAAPGPTAAAPEVKRPARRTPEQLADDFFDVLKDLPEPFDRGDIRRAIGYEPERVALYRLLTELVREGELRIESRGEGRRATTYRRT
jgi:hypothetical protein